MDLAFAPAISLRNLPARFRSPCRLLTHRSPRFLRILRPTACAEPSIKGQKLAITTPLFYVNAAPHMGSAYTTIAADALARFYRMAGGIPVFVTGTDEHGEKIATAARKATNSTSLDDVQSFCDNVASQFEELWEKLAINHDRFVRTTDPHHVQVVKQFMERVWDNGDIYKSNYEGLYCTGCEEYKDPKDLLEGNLCPSHQTKCQNRKEENYFFALSKYQDRLETFLEDNPNFVLPQERRNEVLGWVRRGLRDFSVSRAHNPWGIPIPRDESQTIYVWFDALLGYVSALMQGINEPTLETALELGWPADVHIIGKDILRFHAVYWPAMLMSAGLPLPRRVIGHGFITKDGMKMGKSLGNTIDPDELVENYGSDAIRYYFLRAVDFGRDGDFSEQRFIDIVNADLANSLGNLLNRSLNLLKKNCDSILPLSSSELGLEGCAEGENILRVTAAKAAKKAYLNYEALHFTEACEAIMAISFEANAYIDRIAPWSKFKSSEEADVEAARRCIVNVLEACRIVAVGLSPVTPGLSKKVYEALSLGEVYMEGLDWEEGMQWGHLQEGMTFAKPKPVFPRMEVIAPQAAAVS